MSDTEQLIYDPFNPLNKEITPEDVKRILSKYGVVPKINNFELYRRAFIHETYVKRPMTQLQDYIVAPCPVDCMPLSSKSNERLEYLGDGVLECITKLHLYKRFPKEDEGFMTEKKIALVKNESIGQIAKEIGLNKWFIISKNAEERNMRHNVAKLGCLFEAFLGAIFLDFNKSEMSIEDIDSPRIGPGFQVAQIFVENVFEQHVNWTNIIQHDDNYKNLLQVKIQKEFKITPDYIELGYSDEEGYHTGVYLRIGRQLHEMNPVNAIHISKYGGSFQKIHESVEKYGHVFVMLGEGKHKIKRKAEQLASCEAMKNLAR